MTLRFLLLAIALPMIGLNGQTSLRDEVKNREARSEGRSPQKHGFSDDGGDRLKRMHASYPWMVALDDEQGSSFSPHPGSRSFHQRVEDSVGIEWINGYASTLIPSSDYSSAIATDESGNVYVTGYSTSPFGFRDYTTIKYSGRDIKWVATYDGPIADEDIAIAITVDRFGNVYVTGTSYGGWTRMDYATVMYDSNGVEKWRARYDGSGHEDDVAVAIAVDEAGNSYVTGYSYQGEASGNDYVTIKYGHDGTELWVARYDGPIHGDDFANAIALDGSGDVYVGGGSSHDPNFHKFTLIKYGSDGNQEWVASYSGPLVGDGAINAMAVDSAEFVYVTGKLADRAATIKYSVGGNLMWACLYTDYPEHYDHLPTSIAVDDAGNVFVGGGSLHTTTQWDFLTIMYDSSGNRQWASHYDGPAHADDGINALTIDKMGGLYVTGLSNGISADFATIKYDYYGNVSWTRRFNGPKGENDFANGIAFVPTVGSVYVTGVARGMDSTGYDFHTERYLLTDGSLTWSEKHNGSGKSNDRIGGIAVDEMGNVYLAGNSCNLSDCDVFVLSYGPDGEIRWEVQIPVAGGAIIRGLGLDSSGNIFVYGSGGFSGSLIKLDSDGNVAWIVSAIAQGGCSSWEKLFDVDEEGNSFIAGNDESGMSLDKYNSSGVSQWHYSYPDSGNWAGCATAVTTDGTGGAFISGRLGGYIATVKCDANGRRQWVSLYQGGAYRGVNGIATDLSGNVYVAGNISGALGMVFTVLKYDVNGALHWAVRDSLLGATAIRVAADRNGNVYAIGAGECASGYADFVTAKYDWSGNRLWSNCYSGTGQDFEYPVALGVDANGDVSVTGYVTSLNGQQYATLCYSAVGDQQWVHSYERAWLNQPTDLVIDKQGNVIVTGYSQVGHSFDAGFVVTTIKYSTGSSTHTSEEVQKPSVAVDLEQNYPNPFNPSTRIEYQLPEKEFVTLKVYDVLGREVAVLVNEIQPPGTHSVEFSAAGLASGVYFYRLESGGFVETKRLVLLR